MICWSEALSDKHQPSAITLLFDANSPDCHIMFISGHSGEQSIGHHSSQPSISQLENVSDTISNALENHLPQSRQISTITSAPHIIIQFLFLKFPFFLECSKSIKISSSSFVIFIPQNIIICCLNSSRIHLW